MHKRISLLLSGLVLACGDTGSEGTTGFQTNTGGTATASSSGTDSDTTASTTNDTTASTTNDTTASTTDSTTTSAGTTSDSGGSSGGVFIEDPDGGAGSVECDVWAQDCPAGEKCMPWANDGGNSWNATKCSPVDPNPKQPGDSCTVEGNGVSGVDDCDVAAMCWDVDGETGMGVCVDFCKGSEAAPTCDNPATDCVIANDGVLILCLPGCDPLLQDCMNDDLCVPNPMGEGFICVLDASGEAGIAGDPCECANCCDAGLFCANADVVEGCAGALGCCAPFCDLSDPNASAGCPGAGEECVAWYEAGMEPPGQENVGACVIPQ